MLDSRLMANSKQIFHSHFKIGLIMAQFRFLFISEAELDTNDDCFVNDINECLFVVNLTTVERIMKKMIAY